MNMHDLWADVDHEYRQLATRERTRARSSRAGILLAALRTWLLEEYVAAYCRALTANPLYHRCYWIDALGPGEHGASSASVGETQAQTARLSRGRRTRKVEVQPLPAALQPVAVLNEQLTHESRPIALHGLILEAGSGRRQRPPKAARAPLSVPREGGLLAAEWPEIAPQLLQVLDQSPAVFALNPLAPTLFRSEDLEPLLQRTPPTELCLLVLHKQLESRLRAAERSPAQATALVNLLRSDRWKTLRSSAPPGELTPDFIDGLIEPLVSQIQRHFPLVQRIALPTQSQPAVVTAAPCTLLFATRRQDSLLAMNDAVCRYWRRLEERSHQGLLASEWFSTQQQAHLAEAREQLYQRVLQMGRTTRNRRWPDLRQQLITSIFGRFTQAEYDATICRLLQSGSVRCEWRRRSSASTNAGAETEPLPIPGAEDLLLWPR